MQVLLENASQHRAEWLALRSKTLGSSEIATALGLNPFRSPLQLFLEKTGRGEGFEGNDDTELGHHMEPWILSQYGKKKNKIVGRPDILVCDESNSWATATPDGFIYSPLTEDTGFVDGEKVVAVCEAKNVSHRMMHHWEDDSVPDYAHAQCVWQVGICKLDYGVVAAVLGGSGKSLFDKEFPFDKELMEQMMAGGHLFMKQVQSDTPPSARAGDVRAVENMYKRLSGKVVQLEDAQSLVMVTEYEGAYDKYIKAKHAMEACKEECEGIRARITQLLGDATNGLVPDGEIYHTVKLTLIEKAPYTVTTKPYFNFSCKKVEPKAPKKKK